LPHQRATYSPLAQYMTEKGKNHSKTDKVMKNNKVLKKEKRSWIILYIPRTSAATAVTNVGMAYALTV
jgi:hypothetical protein